MIVSPVVVLGAPRSGTTILERCLALHPDLWHLPGESHAVLEGPFHPSRKGYESNRVVADEVDDETADRLRQQFFRSAINLNRVMSNPAPLFSGNRLTNRAFNRLLVSLTGRLSRSKRPREIRLLEKTPKNTLRVQMLERLFPDARYLFLQRSAPHNIDSIIAGWHAVDRVGPINRQRYAAAGYPITQRLGLLDYDGRWWKFALVPGWLELSGKTLADVAVKQYAMCNHYALEDLEAIGHDRVFALKYEDFVQQPVEVVRQIFQWADLPPNPVAEEFAQVLPRVNEASPGRRATDGLRYSEAVRSAIERTPELEPLQARLGYRTT